MTNLCTCGRPLAGDSICTGCSKTLEIALGNISAYWADLDTVKGRQTRYGDGGGRAGTEKPLPVDLRFLGPYEDGSMLQEAVKNTIATWTRAVMEARPVIEGPAHPACLHITCSTTRRSRVPADNIPACCMYLLGHADWVRSQYWAPEMLDEVENLEAQLRRMVDRPADKLFVGYCTQCDQALNARIGAPMTQCQTCGMQFSVEASRDAMWEQAQDHVATASEIARAISWLGRESVSAERIRKWVERKRLERKGWITIRGRELPTYRIGDVAALVEAASSALEAS